MKVGDLVELSAYGEKCSGWTSWMRGHLGIVVARHARLDDWRVKWFQSGRTVHMGRKYLKHAKVNK